MPLGANLQRQWKLDEGAGLTRADSFGQDDLTDPGGNVAAAAGKIGSCAVFDGTLGQRLVVPAPTFTLAEQSFTFVFGFFFAANPDPGAERPFVCKGDPGVLTTAKMSVSAAFGSLMFRMWKGDEFSSDSVSAGAMPAAGQWHQVAVWQDAANARIGIAVDGGAAVTAAKTLTQVAGNVPFALGNYATAGQPSAAVRIDEVWFWDRVLSAGERTSMWNGGNWMAFPPSDNGPVKVTGVALRKPAVTATRRPA